MSTIEFRKLLERGRIMQNNPAVHVPAVNELPIHFQISPSLPLSRSLFLISLSACVCVYFSFPPFSFSTPSLSLSLITTEIFD